MKHQIECNRIEIDLDSIAYNVAQIKKILGGGTKIMAIVKADGYEHGTVEISKAALKGGAEWLGVASLSEALVLRKKGVDAPILILGPSLVKDAKYLVDYKITPTVFDLELAESLAKLGRKIKKIIPIHIKIDTGLGRLGILPEKAINFVSKVAQFEHLRVEGLYTHFADPEHDKDYTEAQFTKFLKISQRLEERGISIPLKHVASSSVILLYPHMKLNMVRIGTLIYGLFPSANLRNLNKDIDLHPSLQIKSKLTYIKTLPPGSPIGYYKTFITSRPSTIGILPFGFANGLPRKLSNEWYVLVRGQKAPIVGMISMNMCTVDISHIPNVSLGEEVILIGKQGNKAISVTDIAEKAGMNVGEFLTQINTKIPRDLVTYPVSVTRRVVKKSLISHLNFALSQDKNAKSLPVV